LERKIKINSKDPPYAYTMDGKCEKSSKFCDWLTNEIAVPRCAKEGNTAQCRDKTDNLLIGCYTEETCGGNVVKKVFGSDVNKSSSQDRKPAQKEIPTPKKKLSTHVLIVLPIVLVLMFLFVFYLYRRRKSKKPIQRQQLFKKIENQLKRTKAQ